MRLNEMNGIITALITPFDAHGNVMMSALREVIQNCLTMGVHCFYVCGTTREGLSLSTSERKAIAEVACGELRNRGGVMVNISHMEFPVAIDLARHAAAAGADAVSTLPPLYYPVTRSEIEEYYCRLLSEIELPLTLYNIPMLTRVALDDALVGRLLDYARFGGIKHSSEDTYLLSRFKRIGGGRLMVWSGRDAYYLGALAMGADGAIGSSFNLMGDLFIRITEAYRAGQIERARKLQERTNEVHQRLQKHGGVQSIKRCLELIGINAGVCRLPYQPPPAEADPFFRDTLALLERVRRESARDATPLRDAIHQCS